MSHVAVELGCGDVSRWSSFDIWDQNTNIWALMRTEAGFTRWFLKGYRAPLVVCICLISSLTFPHPFVDPCFIIFFSRHQQKVVAYWSTIRPDNYPGVAGVAHHHHISTLHPRIDETLGNDLPQILCYIELLTN